MCTHNLCFEQKYENSKKKNQLKIIIFTAVKNRCMLHRHVFAMMVFSVNLQACWTQTGFSVKEAYM